MPRGSTLRWGAVLLMILHLVLSKPLGTATGRINVQILADH